MDARVWLPPIPLEDVPTAFTADERHLYIAFGSRISRLGLDGTAGTSLAEAPQTVRELVATILAVMGSTLEPEVRSQASNEIRNQYLDAAKARRMLGWSPAFTIDASLRTTIDWYARYFAAANGAPRPEVSRG